MSFLSENVIPGEHGKIFATDAKSEEDLKDIFVVIQSIEGIKDVILSPNKYPKEFTVHTSKMVKVDTIEKAVKSLGFHAISKGLFEL